MTGIHIFAHLIICQYKNVVKCFRGYIDLLRLDGYNSYAVYEKIAE